MKKLQLLGKTFGWLTVIAQDTTERAGGKYRTKWKCRCKCGKEISVIGSNLTKGNSTSCGCKFLQQKKYNFTDLTNQKFGDLIVIKRDPKFTKTRGALWECKCVCGAIVKIPTNGLTSGNNKTCGNKIIHYELNIDKHKYGEIPLSHINAIKQNAIKRNFIFDVTPQFLWELFLKQNKRCALLGIPIYFTPYNNTTKSRTEHTTASLDRIDSKVGYTTTNVRWVHKDINRIKLQYSDDKFLDYCLLFINNYFKNEQRPNWHEYFLMLASDISYRSEDPNIQHGAIITDINHHIIGTGYNAAIRGADINLIPLNNRDEKRKWMIHAEENAILNCTSKNPHSIYITGKPCVNCLQRIINFGIKQVIYINRNGSITDNNETEQMRQTLVNMSNITMIPYDANNLYIKKNLRQFQ